MRRTKKLWYGFATLFALILSAAAFWLHLSDFMPLVGPSLSRAAHQLEATANADASEARLLFCGTGSPATTAERGSPCLALIFNGKLFLFDAGEGSVQKLREFQAPLLKLSMIFLTHLHSDHISGVAQALHGSWLDGRTARTLLIGPPGTTAFLDGSRHAYEADVLERVHALAEDGYDPQLAFGASQEISVAAGAIETVHAEPGLTIEVFRVDHPDWEFAYGYRLTVGGKTIVISGDTAPSDGIRKFAAGADILIHEALNRDFLSILAKSLNERQVRLSDARREAIEVTHTSTLDLATLAEDLNVGQLYLTHLIPPIPDNYVARRAFTSGMRERYSGPIIVARDGMEIDLPAGP